MRTGQITDFQASRDKFSLAMVHQEHKEEHNFTTLYHISNPKNVNLTLLFLIFASSLILSIILFFLQTMIHPDRRRQQDLISPPLAAVPDSASRECYGPTLLKAGKKKKQHTSN